LDESIPPGLISSGSCVQDEMKKSKLTIIKEEHPLFDNIALLFSM
jgi:hypothetical protein